MRVPYFSQSDAIDDTDNVDTADLSFYTKGDNDLDVLVSDCHQSKAIMKRIPEEEKKRISLTKCITPEDLFKPPPALEKSADPNNPEEMAIEKAFEKYTASIYYNVFSPPAGKKLKDFCLTSCRPYIKKIVKSCLELLKFMTEKEPKFFFGNFNSENVYFADDKGLVVFDNLINNFLDTSGVSQYLFPNCRDDSHSISTDFVDLGKLFLEIVIKTPKKDISFTKTSMNPLQLLLEVYKDDPVDETKPVDTELGVDLAFPKSANDSDKMDKMKESIYDLISKLLGKVENADNKDIQYKTPEEALKHPYVTKGKERFR